MSPSLGPASIKRGSPCLPRIWPFVRCHARAQRSLATRRGPGYDSLPPFRRSCVALNDLSLAEFTEAADPFALFELWLK